MLHRPALAGNIALIKQYFKDNRFWAKRCNKQFKLCQLGSIELPGYLLKALVLHSGDSMNVPVIREMYRSEEHARVVNDLYDFIRNDNPILDSVLLHSPPDYYQGYGILNLSNILPHEAPIFDLYITNNSLSTASIIKYKISIPENIVGWSLRITLSWYDPPNVDFVARLLVHDLDLVLKSPSGVLTFGNSAEGMSFNRDEINNNEQIRVVSLQTGIYEVSVQAKFITRSFQQSYGLVITAPTGYSVVELEPETYNMDSLILCISTLDFSDEKIARYESFDIALFNFEKPSPSHPGQIDSIIITTNYLSNEFQVYEHDIEQNYFYYVQSACLTSGCYTMHYKRAVNGINIDLGNITQLISEDSKKLVLIPECNIFLSSIVSEQSFCISKTMELSETSQVCTSTCYSDDHVLLMVELADGFWNGAHYYITDLTTNKIISGSTSELDSIDDIASKSICLPAKPTCYEMRLVGANILEPGPNNGPYDEFEDDALVYFENSLEFFQNGTMSARECPYGVYYPFSVVYICIDGYKTAQLTFVNVSAATGDSLTNDSMCYANLKFEPKKMALTDIDNISSSDMFECLGPLIEKFEKRQGSVESNRIVSHKTYTELFLISGSFSCAVLEEIFHNASLELFSKSLCSTDSICRINAYYNYTCRMMPDAMNIHEIKSLYQFSVEKCTMSSADQSPSSTPSTKPSLINQATIIPSNFEPISIQTSSPSIISEKINTSSDQIILSSHALTRTSRIILAFFILSFGGAIVVFCYFFKASVLSQSKQESIILITHDNEIIDDSRIIITRNNEALDSEQMKINNISFEEGDTNFDIGPAVDYSNRLDTIKGWLKTQVITSKDQAYDRVNNS